MRQGKPDGFPHRLRPRLRHGQSPWRKPFLDYCAGNKYNPLVAKKEMSLICFHG